jgi:hypothetical protein
VAGTDLQTTSPAQYAAHAAFAKDPAEWEAAKAAITTVAQCDEALAMYDAQLVPVVDTCPDLLSLNEVRVAEALDSNPYAKQIAQGLKMLGRKVMPTASEDQVRHWLAAVTVSLCGLPGPVAVQAVKLARIDPEPARFAPEIEPLVRRCAAKVQERYEAARWRLRWMRREIERAANPAPALPPKAPPTEQDWHEFNAHMRAMGLGTRFFFGEPCLDEATGEPVPGALGNMRPLRKGEEDPARFAQAVAVDAQHDSQEKDTENGQDS